MIELHLDICTPEGKTWLARLSGTDHTFGVAREFLRPVSKHTSRSGMTGTAVYALAEDGVYESNEGRRRLGRRYWTVSGSTLEEIDLAPALTMVGERS